jgi:hypothetical protein
MQEMYEKSRERLINNDIEEANILAQSNPV